SADRLEGGLLGRCERRGLLVAAQDVVPILGQLRHLGPNACQQLLGLAQLGFRNRPNLPAPRFELAAYPCPRPRQARAHARGLRRRMADDEPLFLLPLARRRVVRLLRQRRSGKDARRQNQRQSQSDDQRGAPASRSHAVLRQNAIHLASALRCWAPASLQSAGLSTTTRRAVGSAAARL